VESLEKRIGQMESEELALLASDLESLTLQPGWERLVALIADQAKHEEEQATRVVTTVLRQGKPFEHPEPLYRRMGLADGLRAGPAIVNKVLATWATVSSQLEREERG
jgi:hypothetical protein